MSEHWIELTAPIPDPRDTDERTYRAQQGPDNWMKTYYTDCPACLREVSPYLCAAVTETGGTAPWRQCPACYEVWQDDAKATHRRPMPGMVYLDAPFSDPQEVVGTPERPAP